jgi:hypothetical protein
VGRFKRFGSDPTVDSCQRLTLSAHLVWILGQLTHPYIAESRMIHLRRPVTESLMFLVTVFTAADIGMKRGGLSLEQSLVVGVAYDAVGRGYATNRRMAGIAVVFEMGVRGGQSARTYGCVPERVG